MARARACDGTEPLRTRTVVTAHGEVELPYCNICGVEMDEIRVTSLCIWQPGFPFTRKFPLKYGSYLCDECRAHEGFGPENMLAIPWPEGRTQLQAVRDYLLLIGGSAVDALRTLAPEEESNVDPA